MAQPRALIVDDDEPIRVMLATIVAQNGISVDTARDGREAIDKIKVTPYDVILLDLMMPRVNGYDVLRYIREKFPQLLRRTIVATAVPERELKRDLTEPVYKVHTKPFELPRLLADVNAVLAEPR